MLPIINPVCCCLLLLLATTAGASQQTQKTAGTVAASAPKPKPVPMKNMTEDALTITVINGATWNGWTILDLEKSFATMLKKHGGHSVLAPASSYVSTRIVPESSVFTSFDVGSKKEVWSNWY